MGIGAAVILVVSLALTGIAGAQDKPVLVDSIGGFQTLVRALVVPVNRGGKSVNGWYPEASFVLKMDEIDSEDVVLLQWKLGAKKIGTPFTCKYLHHFKDLGLDYSQTVNKVADKTLPLAFFTCALPRDRREKEAQTTHGPFSLQLSFKKTLAGKTFERFATLVGEATKLMQGARNNPLPTWGNEFDAMVPIATLERFVSVSRNRDGDLRNAQISAVGHQLADPYVLIRTWFKHHARGSRSPVGKMVCMHKEKKIAEAQCQDGRKYNYYAYPKKGAQEYEHTTWERQDCQLYNLKWKPREEGRLERRAAGFLPVFYLSQNPGEYKCTLLGEGEVLREISFSVGEDGNVVKSPCQVAVELLPHVNLVSVVEKKPLAPLDRKASRQAFHRQVSWPKSCP
jgi:hypothetical protein